MLKLFEDRMLKLLGGFLILVLLVGNRDPCGKEVYDPFGGCLEDDVWDPLGGYLGLCH
jgi:hypothetical protein